MTKELYKKHRPKSLKRVVGNDETVATLKNMMERSTLPHTLLFSGPSGCGKTTLGRILKKMLDCHDMDFVELDCSANRGIDTIRAIMRDMKLSATGKCRIWLMDECHQLTKDAQHSALKMLEDTPDHVYFFLCTTDPGKLLPTIRTRCCDMPVRRLTEKETEGLLQRVSHKEDLDLSDDTLQEIVDSACGSARSALVLLDKIANLPADQRIAALRAIEEEKKEAIDLCRALLGKKGKKPNWATVCKLLQNLKGEPEGIRWSVMGYARSILLKGKNHQAYVVICAFENHWYDSKNNGLIRACYEAVHGD